MFVCMHYVVRSCNCACMYVSNAHIHTTMRACAVCLLHLQSLNSILNKYQRRAHGTNSTHPDTTTHAYGPMYAMCRQSYETHTQAMIARWRLFAQYTSIWLLITRRWRRVNEGATCKPQRHRQHMCRLEGCCRCARRPSVEQHNAHVRGVMFICLACIHASMHVCVHSHMYMITHACVRVRV